MLERWLSKLARGVGRREMAAVRSQVDDSPGWQALSARGHERDAAEMQAQYSDALTAWRKNPVAWRIIALTADYVVGKSFAISSPFPPLDDFIQAFWNHPKNRLDLRLTGMCEELARAGDLFAALFRDPISGMSYLRFVTKDQIQRIETAENDWETETAYLETRAGEVEPKRWPSPGAADAANAPAIMLHYSVNRPIGALMGESDLATMIPWLLRYSRMLEDRVRLHWAARAFLYLVTVPSTKVESKMSQYNTPPESGSIIVKDESERWETVTPALRGADASHDMKAVRQMIDAGSGYPPHWRGEGGEVNLATAEAMQGPPERHLARRQQYFVYMIEDILYHAYQRAAELGTVPPLPGTPTWGTVAQSRGTNYRAPTYADLFTVAAPDVSLRDNTMLAQAADQMAQAMATLNGTLKDAPPELARLAAALVLKFAGEPQSEATIERVIGNNQF